MKTLADLVSPAVVIDAGLLEKNLRAMQSVCDAAGTELWPHIKTHKMVPILRRQLELGAVGATFAKLGEAEALLPSGVRQVFIAHSLVDLAKAPRLRALHGKLDRLILAVTSSRQCDALERLLEAANITVPVLLAVDTGLHREGTRDPAEAAAVAEKIRRSSRQELIGFYTHEGHAYGASSPANAAEAADRVYEILVRVREEVGGGLSLWPGCSVTAALLAGRHFVQAVRPGGYVFGDLALAETTGVTAAKDVALTVLATVVDRPDNSLALIDAGSKVFSGDKTPSGLSGRCLEFPALTVSRVNEEHGYVTGDGVDQLEIGQRLRFLPAHVCPVVNLTDRVHVVEDGVVRETWPVDARGRSD
ncbi:MAG: alanine racemase [Terrimicrobiaceae bacterium]